MNEDIMGVNSLYPQGTNSTMFTSCCDTAICDDEACCPRCGRKVIGHDLSSRERSVLRWEYATRFWKKK